MPLLLLVSFIWAFSYGLIGAKLAGIDSSVVAALRLALALVVFLPFFRWNYIRRLPRGSAGRLLGIGAIQFGVMYVLYQRAYHYLPSHDVVLFTLSTPLYVALLDALAVRRLHPRYAIAALLAMLGAGVVVFNGPVQGDLLTGFLLMQVSNLCFAAGQIGWRRERDRIDRALSDASLFALPYAGALIVAAGWALLTADWTAVQLTTSQWTVLAYLGLVSSGACFFWWNIGATRVNAGTLAVFNNAKVPLGVACSLLFFHEHADVPRLLVSGALLAVGVWVAEGKRKGAGSEL